MNIFELDTIAINKLSSAETNSSGYIDPTFNDVTDIVTGILTAVGVFPTVRAMLNGHLHKLFSAIIVMAYKSNETIDIPTRKLSNFHDQGMSTQFLKWFDHCVKENLLISHYDNAYGRLSIGDLINRTLTSSHRMSSQKDYENR